MRLFLSIQTLIIGITMLMSVQLSALQMDLRTYNFYGLKPYTEIYLRVDGHSVAWKDKAASVEILMYILDENERIVAYDKYVMSLTIDDKITDLLQVKRYALPVGNYTVRVEGKELNSNSGMLEIQQKMHVAKPEGTNQISDIIPLEDIHADSSASPLVKNGFYMEPLAYHFVDTSHAQMQIYLECYSNEKVSGDLFLQYAVVESGMTQESPVILFSRVKKLQQLNTEPLLLTIPVHLVRSGTYQLTATIIDRNKNVIGFQNTPVTVFNPSADIAYLENYNESPENAFVTNIQPDEIDYVLKAMLPITNQNQTGTLKELIKSNKLKSQRQFIFQLWKSRSPQNPEKAFKLYMDVAKAVDKTYYSTVGYGFQTDRGYIFLKYGKPTNVLTVDDELDAPPYEIWFYNNLPVTSQTNVRFLFYNPSLAHNDFQLLHSTCLGEKSNLRWEVELYKSVPKEKEGNSTDATTVGPNWNRNARKYFEEF